MTVLVTLQAENMTSTAGYGAHVVSDAAAAGGKALMVDSAVTVKGTVTLSAPVSSLTIRARTDGTAASMSVAVDRNAAVAVSVPEKTWAGHAVLMGYVTTDGTAYVSKSLAAGTHTLSITFKNPDARNLYLDSIAFTADATSPEVRVIAYLTGYGYPDNDPPYSDAIAYPTAARPHAGGTGTYADPTTLAVGYTGGVPDLPYGTLFYVPALRRYFRVEDLCGACHGSPRPAGTVIWLDCWVGGKGKTAAYVDAISASLTGPHAVIQHPAPNYVVAPGELADGKATHVTLYSETPVIA